MGRSQKQLDIYGVFCIMDSLVFLRVKGFDRIMNSRRVIIGLTVIFVVSAFASAWASNGYKPEIVEALNNKDTAQVLLLLDREIGIDPAFAPNYQLKGEIFLARNQLDAALEQFDLALNKKSKLFEAQYYKGLVLLRQGKPEEARKVFDDGVRKAKAEKALFNNGMGLYYLEMKDYAKADIEFRKAIQEGPDRAEYHANLGDANYYSQIYPLAISEYNKVIEMDTTNLDIYFRLARAYVAQEQFKEALDQLAIVLVRDSAYANAWKETGKLYMLAGLSARDQETKKQRFTETLGSYRQYLRLTGDSTDGEVFFNIGRAYYFLGAFNESDSALSYVLKLGDVPNGIYTYLGRARIGLERYAEGIADLQRHFTLLKGNDPDWKPTLEDAELYRRLGDAFKATEDLVQAAESYITASDLDSTNARSAVLAAITLHQLQEFSRALTYYERRIGIGPDEADIYLNASLCTISMENYEKTITYLLKVVELDPNKLRAYALLSDTYITKLGDCDNGILWTEKLYRLDSTNCDALITLGFANFGTSCHKNYPKAIDYFSQALECQKAKGLDNCASYNIMLYIAQAYHLHGADMAEKNEKEEQKRSFKNAFDWYNKVLKCDPGNADAIRGARDTEFEF